MKKKIFPILLSILIIAALLGGIVFIFKTEYVQEVFYTNVGPPLIRNITKISVRTVNIEKIKKTSVQKLTKMKDEKFSRELGKVLHDIEEIGLARKASALGIDKNMTREKAVELLDGMDQERLLKIIDDIPDEAIAALLKNNFFRKDSGSPKNEGNLREEVEDLMDDISQKLYSSKP